MEVKPIDFSKTIQKVKSRLPVLLLVLFVSTAVSAGVAMKIPKKYKARFSISIYGRYFKNPLVSEFTPDIAESGELKAQREVLIRQALSQEFLDKLGEKEGLFRYPPSHPKRILERQDLQDRLEVESLNQTTYQVSFVSGVPEQALKVLQSSLSQIKSTLVRERVRNVELLRDALRSQIESLGLSLGKGAAPVPALQVDTLRYELARIRAQIQTNLSVFSESHPVVQRLQARARSIEESIARSAAGGGEAGTQAHATLLDTAPLTNQDPSRAREDLYQDLFKKFNYLGIVAQLEQKKSGHLFRSSGGPLVTGSADLSEQSLFPGVGPDVRGAGLLLLGLYDS